MYYDTFMMKTKTNSHFLSCQVFFRICFNGEKTAIQVYNYVHRFCHPNHIDFSQKLCSALKTA